MGGTALGYEARRVTSEEQQELIATVKRALPEFWLSPIRSYRLKADHGDTDIVVVGKRSHIQPLVIERLSPRNVSSSQQKDIMSFDIDGAQIDLIFTDVTGLRPMIDYFAWNDLGNFIGRTARSIGFKFGQDGLTYPLRLNDHRTENLLVSANTEMSLEFLGYDSARWVEGFNTREEIFEFASSATLFNPLYVSLENQTHQDRVRNKKRKMYQAFLEYVHARGFEPKPKFTEEERAAHLLRAEQFFCVPLSEQIASFQEDERRKAARREKFNGDLAKEWTGLTGQALGAAIRRYRDSYGDRFDDFIDTATPELIRNEFTLITRMHSKTD